MVESEVVSYRNSTSNHNTDTRKKNLRHVVSYRNSTSNHNQTKFVEDRRAVVSYRNSTSNHNLRVCACLTRAVVSYRNSTSNHNTGRPRGRTKRLYLIEILHQTTTTSPTKFSILCCILSKFYIKPQPLCSQVYDKGVVSYRNSTSNHNYSVVQMSFNRLYLIEILHQTTTSEGSLLFCYSCILSKFYIKPQLVVTKEDPAKSCILSKFYIKPQQSSLLRQCIAVVSYRNSTSNHNLVGPGASPVSVVSYRNSTSNHN